MPAIATAIDLGSYSLKVAVGKPGVKPRIDRVVEVFNPSGVALPEDQRAHDALVTLIGNAFTDYKLPKTSVRLALTEAAISSKVISLPPLSDAELASAIQWQAEQHIPIPFEELVLEYQVLYRPDRARKGDQMRVLMVGTRKKVVEAYLDVFYQIGIEPTCVETQTIANMRSLQFTPLDPPTFLVSLGALNTDMAVIDHGELSFVYTVAQGSQLLTKAISQALQQDTKTAEEYKRRYGLDEAALGGKLRQILLPGIDGLVQEIRKTLQFFLSQHPEANVTRMVLTGGGAMLPGLVQHLAAALGMEVLLAAPFAVATGQVPPGAATQYSVAAGLLMRDDI